jgi:hypothetical protein
MPASCPDPLNTTFLRPEKTDPSSRSLSEPMQPAHSRLAHRDILRHILSFVDRPTLAAYLRVNSLFFDIAGSLFYRELNLAELARDLGPVFPGPHTFFGEHLTRTGPIPRYPNNRLLQHIRNIIIPVHLCYGDPYFAVAASLLPKLNGLPLCGMLVPWVQPAQALGTRASSARSWGVAPYEGRSPLYALGSSCISSRNATASLSTVGHRIRKSIRSQ